MSCIPCHELFMAPSLPRAPNSVWAFASLRLRDESLMRAVAERLVKPWRGRCLCPSHGDLDPYGKVASPLVLAKSALLCYVYSMAYYLPRIFHTSALPPLKGFLSVGTALRWASRQESRGSLRIFGAILLSLLANQGVAQGWWW